MALKDSEILDLAYRVGWRKAGDLERVLAITLAESSNNPEAENRCCVGLMAINVLVHKQYTRAQMKNPEANMRAGFALWQRDGWRPWDASRGSQILWGPRARASTAIWHASPGAGEQGASGAVGEAANAVPGLSDALSIANRARAWITTPANLGRLALAVLAGAVIIVGVATLLRPAAETAVKTAAAVKP